MAQVGSFYFVNQQVGETFVNYKKTEVVFGTFW